MRDLAQPLSLRALSETSGFSTFHFHRVFKALVGETPNQFVKRLRLERSLYLMSHAPRMSLTDVALHCGFSSSSDFSRSFRQHFGQAPRRFDLDAFRDMRRADFDRLLGEQYEPPQFNVMDAGANPDRFEVRLRDLPARSVAYLRVFDPYQAGAVQKASERLIAWAEQRGLADGQWLGYMWDEPEIVALADCRYDVALVVDDDVPEDDIGSFRFPAMRIAELDMCGDIHLEVRALDWLYKTWLPHSGYVPDDHPTFEAWVGRPFAHGNDHFELTCQLPIRPA
ncbi:AraC family transcriptional regulator [Roseateles chitinivorans]|uniref:AraC family transcriptional regulator n=1 Tax=Roseateles chitinivorans TaxID=2917965 RepID=UPI003D677AD8